MKTSNAITATTVYVAIMTLLVFSNSYVRRNVTNTWRFKSSGMWCYVDGCAAPKISNALCSFEIKGSTYSTTQHHSLEDLDRQQHCCEGLTSGRQMNIYLSNHLTFKWPTFSYVNAEYCIDSRTNVHTCKHTYCNAGKSVCLCVCWHTKCTTRLLPCYSCA